MRITYGKLKPTNSYNSSCLEFVPLPNKGGDPICGLSRSFWYSLESQGEIKLVRIRKAGQIRGRLLLPVATALSTIKRLSKGKAKHVGGNGRPKKLAQATCFQNLNNKSEPVNTTV
jgi:hypothetical protein